MEIKDAMVDTYTAAADAIAGIGDKGADCVVFSDDLPDMTAEEFVSALPNGAGFLKAPVLICARKPVSGRRRARLEQSARQVSIRFVNDPERLREEIGAVLNPPILVKPTMRTPKSKTDAEEIAKLAGKRVLVVDDDVRNIFALTSLLERYKIEVLFADNGRTAISMLQSTVGVDIVLMDIMMPGMDGFEAMREIRTLEPFRDLPIIALTARAMKGDQEKCIEAGASDYVPKPVAPDQLLHVLCAWVQHPSIVDRVEQNGA
jgi:CheY-like chemotaxis protein